ncbi:MAG: hypothetical protein KJ607_06035 [Bacteroidetes bacterium]|nr:hypothetical protein [Bacteroidota bacterium]
MKRIISLWIIVSTCLNSLSAQEKEEPMFRTIFSQKGGTSWGLSMGPGLGVASINGSNVVMFTNKIDLTVNRQYSAGVALNLAGAHDFERQRPNGIDSVYHLSGSHFGISLKYLFFKNSPFHISVPALVGGGFASIQQANDTNIYNPRTNQTTSYDLIDNSSYFLFAPGLGIDINVASAFHFEIGFSYRMAFGSDMEMVSDKDLSGVSFMAGLKFGRYY